MPRVTITVPESTSQPYRFQLEREVVRLGRGSENDIVIDCDSVSTNHAEMRRVQAGYELHDLGSTNGIKLDGVRYDIIPLSHGATVYLGDVAFDFSLTDEEQELLARELPQSVVLPPPPDVPVATQSMAHLVKPRPVPKRKVVRVERESEGGFGMALLLILFSALAFGVGAYIRFQKDTGGSLIEAVQAKFSGQVQNSEVPAAPAGEETAPAGEEEAAPAGEEAAPAPAPAAPEE